MFSTKSQKIYSIIAGICFSVLPIFSTITYIYYGYFSFLFLLYLLTTTGLAVVAFMGKKTLPFVIVSGVYTLLVVFDLFEYFFFFNVIDFLIYSSLTFFALINCIPALHKKTNIQKYLCFIPCALFILSFFIEIFMGYYIDTIAFFRMLIQSAALLFVGFWLVDARESETVSEDVAITPAPAVEDMKNAIGGAEKLMTYKKLLDDGIITQEEFDEKKKQILDSCF